jgi:hypothetical protein
MKDDPFEARYLHLLAQIRPWNPVAVSRIFWEEEIEGEKNHKRKKKKDN